MSTYTNVGTIRNKEDNVLCLLLGLLGLDNGIFGRVRLLGTIFNLDLVITRSSDLQLSPSTRSNSNLNRLVGVVKEFRKLSLDGINPVESPVFNLGCTLDLEELVDIDPVTTILTDNSLELLVSSRCRLRGILVISMKLNSQIEESTRKEGGAVVRIIKYACIF